MKKRHLHIILFLSILAILSAILLWVVNQKMGLREFFILSHNQVAYSCFGKTVNPNVIKGKGNELFLKPNIDDFTGELIINEFGGIENAKAEARKNVEETKTLIDTLHRHGIEFLFVFCPTKPAVYSEYLPKAIQKRANAFSLADYYIQLFKENGIPHIDFYNHFKTIKDSFPYPLYTRYGSHWAESTIPFVADSILRKLEEVTGFHLPSIQCNELNLTKDYITQDGELASDLNLLFPLSKPELPRPICSLTDTLGKDHPNLLVVGDGYFTPLQRSCFVDAFHRWDFWLYNQESVSSREIYNWQHLNVVYDAVEILEEADVVIALYTSNYLVDYLHGFTQTALELLERGTPSQQESIQIILEHIKADSQWMNTIEQQALEQNLSVEENLYQNAEYVFQQKEIKKRNSHGLQ